MKLIETVYNCNTNRIDVSVNSDVTIAVPGYQDLNFDIGIGVYGVDIVVNADDWKLSIERYDDGEFDIHGSRIDELEREHPIFHQTRNRFGRIMSQVMNKKNEMSQDMKFVTEYIVVKYLTMTNGEIKAAVAKCIEENIDDPEMHCSWKGYVICPKYEGEKTNGYFSWLYSQLGVAVRCGNEAMKNKIEKKIKEAATLPEYTDRVFYARCRITDDDVNVKIYELK